jgi:hypothetical protein
MPLRKIAFVLLVLCALPEVASAGMIEFALGAGNLTFAIPNPGAEMVLVPIRSTSPLFAFDPVTGLPVTIDVLGYDPQLLPAAPAWATTLPDGQVHWDVNGYFGLPITLTDFVSGQSATITFFGQAHMIADFTPTTGWTGSASFSSQDWQQVRLGGNLYSIWGSTTPTPGQAEVNVWVGDGTPPIPQFTPEPSTFALVALGLVPLGFRRLRWW